MSTKRAPRLFRVLLAAHDLGRSRRFYESLFGVRGREVGGGRIYFDCGPVLVGIIDHSADKGRIPPATEPLYFATRDLGSVHRRAKRLQCLAKGLLHGDPRSPLGEIVERPWGERSFYADDPDGNALCFVDERTLFTGTRPQIAALRRAMRGPR
jgi:catechol 2,3-dioxygenase-like lactoylglutathione lyase family enzyme